MSTNANSRFRSKPWLVLGLLAWLVGCGWGNGLPRDLMRHLQHNGITVEPIRTHSSPSSRAGYVVLTSATAPTAQIVAALGLAACPAEDRGLRMRMMQMHIKTGVVQAWALTGRPATLKLRNGSQFEYLYLIVGADGQLYLAAEYAYG